MAHFTIEIGNENYNSTFEALSEDDLLGNTLLQVRDKLKNVAEEMQHQAKLEEQRKWMVEGNAKFVAILQDNEMDIESYTYNILSNLISYLDVNQGAFFLLAKDKETLFLKSAYAYDRRKFLNKEIKVGDGLLGNTALEGKMTYLTDLPQNYISITSGLGEAPPSALLMLPLISENELYGVLELASFRTFEPFELEFCEKIAQNIAQAIGRQQINQQTKELLEQSRQQAEELSAQEEEMRQNLEEMQATQEEMARKESELTGVVNALNVSSLVAEFDLYGNILTVNKKIIDLFGFKSKDEIIGANHRDFYINVDDEVQNDRIWSELENGQIIARKGQIRTPKGDVIWLNETYTPVYDAHQRVSKVLNISFDITEEVMSQQQISQQHEEMQAQEEEMRQNMEEMLATQEEMGKKEAELVSLTSAIDAAALVVYFNLEGEVLNVNDKVLESFGIADRSTIIGLNHRDLYHSGDYEAELGAIWSKLKDKEVVSRLATVHLNNGESILLNETYSPILDEYGSIDRILNISFIQS
jgi:PAS domain S-box-containing protein